jgi:hypothetical protein
MPVRVPAGWKVLATPHFRLAYPPGWTTLSSSDATETEYDIGAPDRQGGLDVRALPNAAVSAFCPMATSTPQRFQPTTLAGLPMQYLLVPYPNGGGLVRWWVFLNTQGRAYTLRAFDGGASAATRVQDDAILATLRPDNTTPWQC